MRSRSQVAPQVQQSSGGQPAAAPQPLAQSLPRVTGKSGPWSEPLAVDEVSVSVTFGKETFYPIKHNGFDVGPITVTAAVRTNETAEQAYQRASSIAEEFFLREFEEKCRGFAERVKTTREKTGE